MIIGDPQVLGLDSVKGSQMIFPVVFKARANQQYGALREFERRVRLALEENHLLPGDPNRVFQYPGNVDAPGTLRRREEAPTPARDPTTIKPVRKAIRSRARTRSAGLQTGCRAGVHARTHGIRRKIPI